MATHAEEGRLEFLREAAAVGCAVEPLEEGTGLLGWVSRTFTNVDPAAVAMLRQDLAAAKEPEARDAVVAEIDLLLKQAEEAKADGTWGDLMGSFRAARMAAPAGAAAASAIALQRTGKVRSMPWAGIKGGVRVFAGTASMAFVGKTVARYSGSLSDYVEGLRTLRNEVAGG